jgi:hypothetical protein
MVVQADQEFILTVLGMLAEVVEEVTLLTMVEAKEDLVAKAVAVTEECLL